MTLVERDNELAQLNGLLAACLRGRGGVAVIGGPIGSGKTELLQALARRAAEDGALYLGAGASHTERNLSLGVIGQLLRGPQVPPDDVRDVSGALETASRATRGRDVPGSGYEPGEQVYDKLGRVILDMAERRPLVIGIDDFHHADIASVRCLSYLTRRVRSLPLLVVLCRATRIQPAHTLFQADLLHLPQSHYIQLRPLSAAAVEQTLRHRLGEDVTPHLAAEFHSVSGGNPALLRGLVADFRGSAETEPKLVAGPGFAHSLLSCLHRFERCVLRLARAVAALGGSADPALAAALAELEVDWVGRALGIMERSGVLAGGRFRHPAAEAAVLNGMSLDDRTVLHGLAARLVHDTGGAATEVARHLLAADELDAVWGTVVLHEAAEEALGDGDVEFARRCLRLARQYGADDARRAGAAAALARVEWRVDPSVAVRYAPQLITTANDGRLAERSAIMPIVSLFWFGRFEEALNALARLSRTQDEETAATIATTRLMLSYTFPALAAHISAPERPERLMLAASTVTPELRAGQILAAVLTRGPSHALMTAAEHNLRSTRLGHRTLTSIVTSLATLIYGDRLNTAAFWCDVLRWETESLCAHTWQAFLRAIRAEIAYRQGEFEAAEQHGQAALSLVPPKSWGVAIGVPLATLIRTSVRLGRPQDAVSYLRLPVPEALFQTAAGPMYLQARGRYHQQAGDLSAALADFRSCGELMIRWRLDLPGLVAWRTDAARVLLRMGEHGYAKALAQEQVKLLGPTQRWLRQVTDEVLRKASGEAADHDAEPGEARSPGSAPAAFGWAAGAAEPGGDRDATYAETDEVRYERAAKLTDAERRVAVLAAQGMTNNQIASRLFVTASTVEQHLTRVYRKLRVNRRDHLPSRLFVDVEGS
jgi:DNA-binding CsgD family transcriptional regulator/vacuolar-type H+-ATPase catalytic subunit A/Vma1